MKCPICDHILAADVLRCPRCNSSLTLWKNLDNYAEQAHRAGLDYLARGSQAAALEMFCRAAAFAPNESRYLDGYGRLLARSGRGEEAVVALRKAHRLSGSEDSEAALQTANEMLSEKTTATVKPGGTRAPLRAAALLDGDVSDTAGGNGQAWALCTTIEESWGAFAPFASLVEWPLVGEDGAGGPLAYLRALRAFTSGEDDEARKWFAKALRDERGFLPAAVYLVVLSCEDTLDQTVQRLHSARSSRDSIAHVLSVGADAVADSRPSYATRLRAEAVRQAEDTRQVMAERMVQTVRTPEELSGAATVLEECTTTESPHELLLLLAGVFLQLDRAAEAERVYRAAAESHPCAWEPHFHLAVLYRDQDAQRALEWLATALQADELPVSGQIAIHSLRLEIHWANADWASARDDARALAELVPEDPRYVQIVQECDARAAPEADVKDQATAEESSEDNASESIEDGPSASDTDTDRLRSPQEWLRQFFE